MKDIIDIREQGGAGRMVYLLEDVRSTPSPQDNTDMEVRLGRVVHQAEILYQIQEEVFLQM